MSADQLLREGNLDEALAALQNQVRAKPADAIKVLNQLGRVLFLQPNRARRGVNQAGTPAQFVAFPAWVADSLAFVPYSMDDVQHGRPGATPSTTLEAIAHNKETLRRLTASWVASAPESADAFEAHASVLELLGETDVARDGTTAPCGTGSRAARGDRTPRQLSVSLPPPLSMKRKGGRPRRIAAISRSSSIGSAGSKP